MRKLNFEGYLRFYYNVIHIYISSNWVKPFLHNYWVQRRLTVISMGQTSLQMLFSGLITFEVQSLM